MRIALDDTIEELENRRKRLKSLDAVRHVYDIEISKGTLSRILHRGSVSAFAENSVRIAFDMAPCVHSVPACPDCGSVHTGRCHNRPVSAVVILAPDERVVARKPTAKPDRRPTWHPPDEVWAAWASERIALRMTWKEYFLHMEKLRLQAKETP